MAVIIAWVSWVLTIAAAAISFFDDEEPPFQDYDEGTHYHVIILKMKCII